MPRGIRNKLEKTIYVAKEVFVTILDGSPVTIMKGTTVRDGHPLLRGRESLFQPLTVEYDLDDAAPDPGPDKAAQAVSALAEAKPLSLQPAPAEKGLPPAA